MAIFGICEWHYVTKNQKSQADWRTYVFEYFSVDPDTEKLIKFHRNQMGIWFGAIAGLYETGTSCRNSGNSDVFVS